MEDGVRSIVDWLAGMMPASLQGPQATVQGAQLTAGAALVAAVFALFAALIAGGVALRNGYLTVRTTAQVKHAEFRQKWIDALRDEMVVFQSLAIDSGTPDPDRDRKLVSSSTKILLLMNPKDADYQKLLDALQGVLVGAQVSRDAYLDAHADLIMLCQQILKREWNVTKREMHATAHFFWVRWLLALWKAVKWMARGVWIYLLQPFAHWAFRRTVAPMWRRHGQALLAHTPRWILGPIQRVRLWRSDRRTRLAHAARPAMLAAGESRAPTPLDGH
ncbi:hypothetical protein [Brevundimonas nasdae]|uniref:hypothetical protein n=1 Tax=Brevundimonas nasdae TaxID=172043 RepID=UPI0030192D19